ncbi:MAG: DUF4258 domain-containing protein [Candidatus Thorarchaeota archaeon]
MIIFSKHALERMKQRGITKDEVLEALSETESPDMDTLGHFIAQKTIRGKILRVFFQKKGNDTFVITAYLTSKIKKYSE